MSTRSFLDLISRQRMGPPARSDEKVGYKVNRLTSILAH